MISLAIKEFQPLGVSQNNNGFFKQGAPFQPGQYAVMCQPLVSHNQATGHVPLIKPVDTVSTHANLDVAIHS